MIRVDQLVKRFGPITALDGLSLKIDTGEVVGFLGPNGAGKTTAMRIITGYYAPDSGEVEIDGVSVLDDPISAQSKIGYLPENNPLYKEMLVAEFLTLSARLKHVPKSGLRDALDYVVNAVGIDDVFYRPIGQLSKGYKQRVGIAMALVHRPRILIMDEPTEGLDPIQRGEIRSLIRDLAKDHTIIMSTHVMQEAQAVSNRIIIINKGKLVADGSAAELTRTKGASRIITLEAEGKGIEKAVGGLKGVNSVEITASKADRITLAITVDEKSEIRPQLSKLTADRSWVIWKLLEEENKLEDVFHQLTSAGGSIDPGSDEQSTSKDEDSRKGEEALA